MVRPPRAVRVAEPARAGQPRRNRVGAETEPLAVKHDGEPDEGEPGGSWKRNILTMGTQMNDPAGNRKVHHGYAPYRQVTSPRQLPTQPTSAAATAAT
jgi:hypothetical protein